MPINPFDEDGPLRVLHINPVGTVAELKANGLNPAQFGACHARVKNSEGKIEIVGCGLAHLCNREEKGVSGPHNFGLRWIKNTAGGPKVTVFVDSCMGLAEKRKSYELNGFLDVIAKEGETVTVRGSDFTDITVPGEGVKRVIHDRADMEMVIPKFPRPHENPELIAHIFASKHIAGEADRRRNAERDRVLGLETKKEPAKSR